MGVIIGVIVGYALGTHAGEEGWTEFKDAWKVVSTSDEVRDLLAAGFSISGDLIGRGSELLAGVLRTSDSGPTLQRVA